MWHHLCRLLCCFVRLSKWLCLSNPKWASWKARGVEVWNSLWSSLILVSDQGMAVSVQVSSIWPYLRISWCNSEEALRYTGPNLRWFSRRTRSVLAWSFRFCSICQTHLEHRNLAYQASKLVSRWSLWTWIQSILAIGRMNIRWRSCTQRSCNQESSSVPRTFKDDR